MVEDAVALYDASGLAWYSKVYRIHHSDDMHLMAAVAVDDLWQYHCYARKIEYRRLIHLPNCVQRTTAIRRDVCGAVSDDDPLVMLHVLDGDDEDADDEMWVTIHGGDAVGGSAILATIVAGG